MYCDRCGSEVQSDHRFCSKCGREFSGQALAYPRENRVREHIRLVGILWLALSALNAVGGVVLYVIAHTLFPHLREIGEVSAWLPTFLTFIGVLILVKAALGFLAGWGLLQREPWARMLTIVLSFLGLFNVPFGTALGVYSLWVLLPSESEASYQEHTRTVTA